MATSVTRRGRSRPTPLVGVPTVSVVIPVFNYGRFLGACLESVLTQPGADLDVIVIDDASSDDSVEVAERAAAADPRIRVVVHRQNRGHIPTVNEAMELVRGEYVVKLDADDMLTPGSLGRSLALMEALPDVGMAYGFPITFQESPPPPARTSVRDWTVWSGLEWLRLRCVRGANCIRQPEAIMRTSTLHKAGPYDPELPHTSDFSMWMRLATLADVGHINGVDQGYYREHAQSMSRTVNGGLQTDLLERIRAFDRTLVPSDGLPPAAADELRDVARRSIAREALGHAISARFHGTEAPEEFVELARAAYPELAEFSEWRTLQRALATDSPSRSVSLQAREAALDLKMRLRWRHWRRSGV